MIKTIITPFKKIPSSWIFENYCNLSEKLHGQDVKITSMFNKNERTPSMCIYFDGEKYYFKDFSSGECGDGLELVKKLYNLSFTSAVNRIENDYNSKRKNVISDVELVTKPKYKVTSHIKRSWTESDAKFWTKYNIGSRLLKKYNVLPLEQYTLSKKNENEEIEDIIIKGKYIYGYFKSDGELYKVYQPYRNKKFINVTSYIQGSEQLKYESSSLIICSSLKDIMSLESLGYDVECIAPGSENSMIPLNFLSACSLKYKNIYTFFDNDDAGHNSMQNYKERYNIPGIYLKMSKDISDSIRDFSPKKVKQYLTPLMPKNE